MLKRGGAAAGDRGRAQRTVAAVPGDNILYCISPLYVGG